jgi:hypothetical protein
MGDINEGYIKVNVEYKFPQNYIPPIDSTFDGEWPRENWEEEEDLNWNEILKDVIYRRSIKVEKDKKTLFTKLMLT